MKVALLVPGGVDRGGTERVIPCLLWLIERLVAAAVEVHVFAHAQEPVPGRWPLLGASVHNAGRRPRRPRMLAALLAEHHRTPFDVLHAVWASPAGVVAAAARALLGVPVLLHLTGGDLADLPDICYGTRARARGRVLLRFALTGADRITVPSTAMLARARALGISATRLPYGVALDRWPPAPPRRRTPGAPARLLHVASLNAVKDQETLLRAAACLRDEGIDFHLDIVGVDTLDGAVHRRARALGLEEWTTFHGFVRHPQLRPLFDAADLLLVSSRHEADPVVLLEAAAAGVPAVGTRVGHFADWSPTAALAVPVADAPALARAAATLLGCENHRLRLAGEAQRRALTEDADWTAREILGCYARLLHGRRSAALPR